MCDHELNIYIYTVTSQYPTDNSCFVLSCTVQPIQKVLSKFYFAMFVFWAVGLRSHPCPITAFAYIMYNIHILKLTKYFGWPRVGTYLSKTFPVSYMFDSKHKLLGPKISLPLRENERQSTKYRFITIGTPKIFDFLKS